MISFLLAMDQNQLIGRDNQLPWHLPSDMRYFKQTTMGHPVIMGRKTYDSIGKPLPGRENIVLTHNPEFSQNQVTCFLSVEEFLRSGSAYGRECFVIGGAGIFKAFLPYADRLYITHVDAEFEGDTYFTGFIRQEWRLIRSTDGIIDRKNRFPHTFCVYERA
ncbi:dihydrofolate reductase [Sporolactobacillus shoreicorticis]|uniref:Dihydrofolate reductase n=1 Tax=Sporolactobacillus shoreicorticis TaxID=1923877 RepID=A0ABW5S6C7_9BACL|nr:dihydrofolate reductase [Sporolactobacillus shoreicorticis]MCO7125694.1 dihydrofolate reductase [Sporolactobacillus shoreicorticis]